MFDEMYTFMGFRGGRGHRAGRGDITPIILRALLKKPMHGYEIISHLEEVTHGMWRPSAGSVYPNLQLLEERGLAISKSEDGKKIYTLTDEGKKMAEHIETHFKAHWEHRVHHGGQFKELKLLFGETMGILHHIAEQDSDEKYAEVKKIFEEMRDKLQKIVEKE